MYVLSRYAGDSMLERDFEQVRIYRYMDILIYFYTYLYVYIYITIYPYIYICAYITWRHTGVG